MSGKIWTVTCGQDKLSGDGGAEYPCVRRYRHRRLLSFLWLQGFRATYESMVDESDAMMFVPRLSQLVLRDQWRDATRYLSRFLPPPDTCSRRPTSVEAVVFHRLLAALHTLANIVGGVKEPDASREYQSHDRSVCPGAIRLRSIILNIQHARASIDWECVKEKVANIVDDLAYVPPELKDLIYMPCGPMKPHNVLPIGFGFRRKYHTKKKTQKPKAPAARAKSYLVRRRRLLPASSDPSQKTYNGMLTLSKALDWVADILDECLKASKLPVSHQVHPLQTSGMEDATAAPLWQCIRDKE